MLTLENFPEKIRKFLEPSAPKPMQMMLARGMVPVPPKVQLCSLHMLVQSQDPEIVQAAQQTAKSMPIESVTAMASERMPPDVLHTMSLFYRDRPQVLEALILNAATANETLIALAKDGDETTCELCAKNQRRLLEAPEIIYALYFNRNTRASTSDWMLDFAARNNVDLSPIPCAAEIIAAIQGEAPKTIEEIQAQDAAFNKLNELAANDIAEEKARKALLEGKEEPIEPPLTQKTPQETAQEEQKHHSAAGNIRLLNVAQRVRLAILGTQSERAVLINDTNKIVSRAVIRSPGVQIQEAIQYAHNKSLPDEIVAFMSQNKKWTRSYAMRLALVQNPKTPLSTAFSFMSGLRLNDLRIIARSHGLPPPVVKAATTMIRQRNN